MKDTSRGGFIGRLTIDGKQYVRRGKTKSEVSDKLNALRRDHLTGNLSADTTTVEALLTHYLDRAVPNRKGGNLSPRLCTATGGQRITSPNRSAVSVSPLSPIEM